MRYPHRGWRIQIDDPRGPVLTLRFEHLDIDFVMSPLILDPLGSLVRGELQLMVVP